MVIRLVTLLFVAAMALGTTAATAQDQGRVGLTMGYPASVGVLVKVSDAFAVRPEMSFSWSSSELTLPVSLPGLSLDSEQSSTTVGVGASLLAYVATWDQVRAYVSPRVAYSHSTSTSTVASIADILGSASRDESLDSSAIDVAGSVGVQYVPTRRFGIFGEVGVEYSRAKTSTTVKSTTNAVGVRSGAGVIWFF